MGTVGTPGRAGRGRGASSGGRGGGIGGSIFLIYDVKIFFVGEVGEVTPSLNSCHA